MQYAHSDGSVYPYGVDPHWYYAKNELLYLNSLKMKLSVILGVIQMVFGIILSAFNHAYFNDWISFFCEFVPQFLFMMSTFGYMIFIIIFKVSSCSECFGREWLIVLLVLVLVWVVVQGLERVFG